MMTWDDFERWEQASRQCIDFKVVYVDMADDLVAGLLLSQIVYYHLPSKKGNRPDKMVVYRDGHKWIAKAHHKWYEETRIRRLAVIRALKKLRAAGLIKTKVMHFAGHPTTHIRIVQENFLERLAEVMSGDAWSIGSIRWKVLDRDVVT